MTRTQTHRLTAMAAGLFIGAALAPAQTVVGWGYNNFGEATVPPGAYKAVSAGSYFALGLKSDGTLAAWGEVISSQTALTPPSGLNGVIAAGAGFAHCAALQNGGTVVAWGNDSAGQTDVPAGLTAVAISVGGYHTLALQSGGTVVAWGGTGSVNYGQATPPSGLTGVIAVAAGQYHSLALKSDGTVVGWGSDFFGETTIPPGLTGVVALAAGSGYSLALESNGQVIGWGTNGSGQTTIPAGLTGVIAIAAGQAHSVALTSNGTVVVWGDNSTGETTIPAGLTGVVSITAGIGYSLALQGQATATGWGDNSLGQLTISPGSYKSLAAGYSHVLGLETNGTVAQWGDTSQGQGAPPAGLSGVVAIAAGFAHSLALQSNGTVVQWGSTTTGQGTVPAGLTGVKAIAAGYYNSLALLSDGTVVAWGSNTGETSVPAGLTAVVAITGGTLTGYALKSDGTVVQWGSNSNGQGTVPAGLTGVVAIAAGQTNTVALKSDGTVVAWGSDLVGESNVPAGLTNVIAISTENSHSLALESNGTVVAWGYDLSGQANVPANLTGVISVAAGGTYSLALTTNAPVTIGSTPSNMAFTVTGAGCAPGSYNSPQTLAWMPGSSCTVAFNTTQNGSTGTQYVFSGWSDGTATASRVISALPGANTYTANFTTQYELTTVVSPAGAGTVTGGGAFYDANSSPTVTATANTSYQFVDWTGAVAQSNFNPTTVPMTGPLTVTANFLFVPSITIAPVAGGTGASVTLSATIGPAGQAFTGNVQFRVGTASVGSSIPVTGAGTYTTSYTITQTPGPYTTEAILSSTTTGVAGNSAFGTLTVLQSQTITFPAINSQAVGAQIALSATATSNLLVTFAATPADTGICTVSGTTATMTGAGSCTIIASQPGDSLNWAPAQSVSQSFSVNTQTQTITWATISPQMVGAQVALSATAPGGTVTFAGTASDNGICTVSGTTATMTGGGNCTITASQAGNATYAAASISQTFTVNKQTQTITWSTIGTQVVGAQVALNATAPGGTVTFAGTAADNGICTVSGTTATMTGAGNCTITASQAGNGTYASASISQTFTVNKQTQTITWATIGSQLVGAHVALSATAPGGTVTFAGTNGICTVSGTTATMTGAGNCTITASQLGNGTYAAASIQQTFTVTAPAANFTITPIPGSETITRGELAGFILELQSVNKFNGSVTLKCSGGPSGAVCADLPQTVKVNGTAYAVSGILFPANTKSGTYTMTFTGVSGSLTNSTTATFTVK